MQNAFYPMPVQTFVPMMPVYAYQPQFDTTGFQNGFVQNPLPTGIAAQSPFMPSDLPASLSNFVSAQGTHTDDPYLRGPVPPMGRPQPQMAVNPLDMQNLREAVDRLKASEMGLTRPPMGGMGVEMGMPPMIGRPPIGLGQGTPPGYFTKDHEQLEKYAHAIGDSIATNIMFDNVSAEVAERLTGRGPRSPYEGPFADLSNPQLYKEANHLYTDMRKNVQIMGNLMGPINFADPLMSMTFDRDVSKLGAMTVIIDRMADKGWNGAAPHVSGPMRLEPAMNSSGDGHVDYTPYAPTYVPMSTSPYVSNFNTMTTAPTYANYMLTQQPAWLN
jgi:hypothetical protein